MAQVAAGADAPFVVCEKERSGDCEVRIANPRMEAFRDRQPVLVDDIASSGRTLAVAAKQLVDLGFAAPDCVVVHSLFAATAYQASGIGPKTFISRTPSMTTPRQ